MRRETLQSALDVAILTVFVLAALAAYFSTPPAALDLTYTWSAFGQTVLALAMIAAVYYRGIYRLRTSRRPMWRAASLVVIMFVTFVLVFAYAYLSLEARSPGQLPGLETHLDAVYFTVTMLATVGFGDIAPTGQVARGVATVQMIFNLAFLGFIVRTAMAAGRRERQRREAHRLGRAVTPGASEGHRGPE